jgi:hypothetical protein
MGKKLVLVKGIAPMGRCNECGGDSHTGCMKHDMSFRECKESRDYGAAPTPVIQSR